MSRKLQHLIAYVLCIAMIFTTCVPTVTLAEDVAIVPTEDVSIATETPVSGETPTVEEATAEPTTEPTAEPVVEEPTEEPVVEEATAEPTTEPTAEPVVEEPTEEPAVEEPTEEPVVEEPTEEPAVEEPTEESAEEEPTAEPTEEPVVEEPAVDYTKSVAENEAFTAGYAKVNGSVEVTADAEGKNVIATLASGSVVYVAERPESGAADELVKIGFYAEEAGVMEGYAAAKALRPLDEDAVAALQGVEKYHGHALPAANVTLPAVEAPATAAPAADAAATETPAPAADATVDGTEIPIADVTGTETVASDTDISPAAPVVTVDTPDGWVNERINFTLYAPGAEKYSVKEIFSQGGEIAYEIDVPENNVFSIIYDGPYETNYSFSAYVDGEWTPYCEPIAITVKSMGVLDEAIVTAPERITNKRDLTISWTAVENAEKYTVLLWWEDEFSTTAFFEFGAEQTSCTLRYPDDIALKTGTYTIEIRAWGRKWEESKNKATKMTVEEEFVSVSNVTVPDEPLSGMEITASATVTGGSGLYAYNYWLYDNTGTIVDRKENTFDTSWTFKAPKAGMYLVRIYATDFATDAYADSIWFNVQSNDVVVSDVTVTGEILSGMEITASATVTGGSGLYAYNYWLYDNMGTIVDRKENTFDTSWTFKAPKAGMYLMRIYATDFATDAYADSVWFNVQSNDVVVSDVTVPDEILSGMEITASATVKGGSGLYAYNYWLFDRYGTIVDRKENTFDTSWTFTAPKEGVYLVRIYATDFETDAYADCDWFYVQSNDVAVSDVTVTGEMTTGQQLTASATVTGGSGQYTYYYWLIDSIGTIVDCKENTSNASWTFTVPAEGVYRIRIYATDSISEAYADCDWFYVQTMPEGIIGVDAPRTYSLNAGEKKVLAFTAPADGTYYFTSYSSYDTYGELYSDEACTNRITYDDDSGNNTNFLMSYDMTEGETVYFRFRFYGSGMAGDMTVAVLSRQPLEFVEIYFLDGTQHVMCGQEVPIDVIVTPKDNLTYSYYLMEEYDDGDILLSKTNTTDLAWTFNAPTETGTYIIKVVATNGVETVEKTEYLYVQPFSVTDVDTVLNDDGELTSVKAYTNAIGTVTYSFFLMDAQDSVLQMNANSTSSTWTFDTPVTAGLYKLKVVACFGSQSADKTVSIRVGELMKYFSANQYNGIDIYVGMTLQDYVDWRDESFLVSYWLLNESGTVVAEKLNTTDRWWSLDAPTVGGYHTVRAVVAYKGQTRTYETTLYVATLVTLQLDQPVTIVSQRTDAWNNETYFTFTAPEDGIYYIRANGDVSLSFSGDGRSVQSGVDDVCTCYEMEAGSGIIFAIRCGGYGSYTVKIQKSQPVAIASELDIERDGFNVTVDVPASGASAYSYYLLNASGQVVLSNADTAESQWSFTVPSNGTYQVHVVVTNGVETAERYSKWMTFCEPVTVELGTTTQTYGAAVQAVFVAPRDGEYRLTAHSMDDTTALCMKYGDEGINWDGGITCSSSYMTLSAGEVYEWYITSVVPTGMELTVTEYTAQSGTRNSWTCWGDWNYGVIGGRQWTFEITKITDETGASITPVLLYELHRYSDNAAVLASDWTYDRTYTMTLPDVTDEYYLVVYASVDGVNISTFRFYVGYVCASSDVINLTEGVTASSQVVGQVFAFQAPATGEYRIKVDSDEIDMCLPLYDQNFEETDYYIGQYWCTIDLEQGEWIYLKKEYSGDCSVTISRCDKIEYIGVSDLAMAGKEAYVWVETNFDWADNYYLNWTLQLYTRAGVLVDTKTYAGDYYLNFYWTMPQQSGEYFIRVILSDGIVTEYQDSNIFTVYDVVDIAADTQVTVSKGDCKLYRFTAPASGVYAFGMTDSWFDGYDTYGGYWEPSAFYYIDDTNYYQYYLTKGEVVYLIPYAYNNEGIATLKVIGSSVVMTTNDFQYTYNDEGTGVVIMAYTGTDASVTVPAMVDNLPVVAIGDSAFENNQTLTSIDLPDSVQVIGVRAFANCTNLTTMS